MTLDGSEEIAKQWSVLLGYYGYRIDFKSVFVHSKPWVVSSAGRCELADLLVVIDHIGPSVGPMDRRAVLIQAKLLKGGRIRLNKSNEQVQFDLLSQWPTFVFDDLALYDSRPRDFQQAHSPGSPVNSGEYGGIDLPPTPRTWIQELVSPPNCFGGTISLASLLANMTCGVDKHGRMAVPNGSDDWSFTVDELLDVTSRVPITKASGIARGTSHAVGFLTVESGGDSGGDAGSSMTEEFWQAGPISTVQFTISHEESSVTGVVEPGSR